MDGAIQLVTSDPLPHIPSCKIRGRLIPAYDFLPRLKKLCFSLGFNDPVVTRSGETAKNMADHLAPGSRGPDDGKDEHDHIAILAATIPYEQNWGAYIGLPGQQIRLSSGTGMPATPADFIAPYIRQYRFAQEHIRLGCDSAGRPVIIVPDFLVSGKDTTAGVGLQVNVARIAQPGETSQRTSSTARSLVTLTLAAHFRQTLKDKNFSWQSGIFSPIGEHLTPELFSFTGESWITDSPAFPEVAAMMPWIVAHKTPHLAATLVHLQTGFSGVCETFAATGPEDLRNLICVAGLEIDMQGFRGRKERYFVPWQACWKRHGYCYGNIYPLLQDDLFVALMNFNRMGSGAE